MPTGQRRPFLGASRRRVHRGLPGALQLVGVVAEQQRNPVELDVIANRVLRRRDHAAGVADVVDFDVDGVERLVAGDRKAIRLLVDTDSGGLDVGVLHALPLDGTEQRVHLAVGRIHRIGLILPSRVGDVIDHALRAVCAKSLYHFCANPARAAGDQHNFASEIERISHLPI